MFTDYEDQFQYFLFAALLFLIFEFVISERKSKWIEKLNLFGEKIMKNIFLFFICYAFGICFVSAQTERALIRKGNEQYKSGKFTDAELNYRKSMEKNNKSSVGNYNLGNSLYKQKKFDEAAEQFQNNLAIPGVGKQQQSNASYNLGNSLLNAQKYEESIEAYKKALKNSPQDEDARYNLAYAQSKLMQQQQQQKQDNKDNKENKDQQKDKKQQQQDKKEGDKPDNQKPDQAQNNNKEDKQKQQQAKQPKISKQDAERMLQALKNDEKNLQKKLAKKEATRIKVDKDW